MLHLQRLVALTGDYLGIPADGVQTEFRVIDIYRQSGGKLAENWVFIDLLHFWKKLGVDFLALVETNRFKYFESEHEYDDAWWFFEQARQCVFELAAGRPMERHMRWFVPETAKVSTPWGSVAVHDDRLILAALIAEADKLVRERKVMVGRAESVVIRGVDPIEELSGW